ncbi:MAG: transporter substrate-binding domain-containing protein [Alkalimonas sp.]|nr:transporter substrate-binding domain-containing protein [Alkalimonas sp.]
MSLLTVQAKTVVRVGAYEFPPYIEIQHGVARGFTVDLIRQLNRLQNDYHFELFLTTPIRRHQDYQQNLFDAIFFEDHFWGWAQREIAIDNSAAFAKDDEVFIALKSTSQQQGWFDDMHEKTIAGILGYHYNLVNYETDPERLATTYNMILVSDHQASIELVLKKRADTAIVTRSFLSRYLAKHPEAHQQLLISNRVDQSYQHQLLINPDHPLPIETLYQWVQQLLHESELSEQWQQSGLTLLPQESD